LQRRFSMREPAALRFMAIRARCRSFSNAFVVGTILLVGLVEMPAKSGSQKANVTISIPAEGDEFVGPFSSWSNLKTSYTAVGDGLADDTAAIQNALDELGTPGHSRVLFLPAGKYRITKTLVLAFKISLSVVGEDPATTTIIWSGAAGGNMLSINGVAYSRFTRLTFD